MFQQLVPLLRQRSILLTVTRIEDDQVRVNVMPKKLAEGENTGLTTPMSFTGAAAELDEQLPAAISSFVASHLQLKNTLTRAKEEMGRSCQGCTGRGPQQGKERKEGNRHRGQSNSGGEEGCGNERGKQRGKNVPPSLPGFFDSPEPAAQAAPEAPAPTAAVSSVGVDEENELLAEIAEDEQDDTNGVIPFR